MALDQQYLDAIKQSEGFVPQASWDYKQYTNGYGTKAQYPGEIIDKATAEQRFNDAISQAEAHVNSVAPNAPPGVKAALTSLTFNAGPGWSQSGLGDLVRAGDWQGAQERFQQYNKAGGQVNPGLVKRRGAEAAWFNSPDQPTVATPFPESKAIAGAGAIQRGAEIDSDLLTRAAPQIAALMRPAAPLQIAPQTAPSSMPAFGWSPQQAQQPTGGYETPMQFQQPQINAPPIFYAQRHQPQLASLQQFLQTRLRPGFSSKG
jgi:lysozyme